MVEQAVIVAGGLGARFGDRTKLMPKGFIEIDENGRNRHEDRNDDKQLQAFYRRRSHIR